LCPTEFVFWNINQANRAISISYRELLGFWGDVTPLFSIGPLGVSLLTLWQAALALIWVAWCFLRLSQRGQWDEWDVLRGFAGFILLLPVMSLSNNYRYFQWFLAIASILLVKDGWASGKNHLVAQFLFGLGFAVLAIVQMFSFPEWPNHWNLWGDNHYQKVFALVYLGWLGIVLGSEQKGKRRARAFCFGALVVNGLSSLISYLILHLMHLEELVVTWATIGFILYLGALAAMGYCMMHRPSGTKKKPAYVD
jgi:hypothetical protein